MAKPLSKLGEHSYVYYLWQYPIMTYSLEYFKWSDIDYNYTVVLQIIILIVLSEISYKFLIESKQGSIILRRIFFSYICSNFNFFYLLAQKQIQRKFKTEQMRLIITWLQVILIMLLTIIQKKGMIL